MDWTAIATLILACFTALLVLATFQLAKQSGEDVRAQWRPVLLIRTARPGSIDTGRRRPIPVSEYVPQRPFIECEVNDDGTYNLTVLVENAGRGPALEVRPFIHDQSLPSPGLGRRQGSDESAYTATAPGELTWFTWSGLTLDPTAVLGNFAYSDISNASFRTNFVIEASTSGSRLVWQGVESLGVFKLAWWQAIVPRPLRKHLRPLTRRYLRRRYRIELPK